MNKGTLAIIVLIVVVAVVAAYFVFSNSSSYAQQQAQIAATQQQQAQLGSEYTNWYNSISNGLGCNPYIPGNNCGGGKVLFQLDSSILGGFL
jgi:uncharacterized protein YpmB